MIIGKKNNENIYIIKKQNENKNIGHVLTSYYTNKLNLQSLHKITQMQIIHKARMKTRKHKTVKMKPTIIEITDKTKLKLNFKYFKKGSNDTKIGHTFYLTKSSNDTETFTHWENCTQNESNQQFIDAIMTWEKKDDATKRPQKISEGITPQKTTKENITKQSKR